MLVILLGPKFVINTIWFIGLYNEFLGYIVSNPKFCDINEDGYEPPRCGGAVILQQTSVFAYFINETFGLSKTLVILLRKWMGGFFAIVFSLRHNGSGKL